jgi:N6-L-threonylcarbamoyladenine synthase
MNDYFEQEVLGKTIDDAAGEAFDKAAKMLGLPYPGGPLVDQYAKLGNEDAFVFPMPNIPNLDFSFSGLKTSILYFLRKQELVNPNFIEENLNDLCASIQKAFVKHLMKKLVMASVQTDIKQISLAGGVSANSKLRYEIEREGKLRGWQTFIPAFAYCTDNAAMIAMAAHYKFLTKDFETIEAAPFAR